MSVPHKYINTPVELLWNVREKVFGNKHVLGLTKSYLRLPKPEAAPPAPPPLPPPPDILKATRLYQSGLVSAQYIHDVINEHTAYLARQRTDSDAEFLRVFGPASQPCQVNPFALAHQVSYTDDPYCGRHYIKHVDVLDTAENFARGFERLDRETAFEGFRVFGTPGWSNEKREPTHDLPRCDMKFTFDQMSNEDVRSCLIDMKVYAGGAELFLYKTTNSFHVYIGHILNRTGIRLWFSFLNELDKKYPGVIDSAWLRWNSDSYFQPLRLSETEERCLPQLYCVI